MVQNMESFFGFENGVQISVPPQYATGCQQLTFSGKLMRGRFWKKQCLKKRKRYFFDAQHFAAVSRSGILLSRYYCVCNVWRLDPHKCLLCYSCLFAFWRNWVPGFDAVFASFVVPFLGLNVVPNLEPVLLVYSSGFHFWSQKWPCFWSQATSFWQRIRRRRRVASRAGKAVLLINLDETNIPYTLEP